MRLWANYPAMHHRRRVAGALERPLKSRYILIRGSFAEQRGFSDQTYPFDQESCFFYMTGATSPGWSLLYDIEKDYAAMYIPAQRAPRQVAYMGQTESIEEVLAKYDVDDAFYLDELGKLFLQQGFSFYQLEDASLMDALSKCRAVKDSYEVARVRKANIVSCDAHRLIAQNLKKYTTEREVEADFLRACRLAGATNQAYNPIMAAGNHASILHYGTNDAVFGSAEVILVDAAAEWKRYAADVTRTYPLGGKFSPKARQIYEHVYDLQMLGISMLKPGVAMQDIQKAVMEELCRKLCAFGFFNCNVETCIKLQLGVAFLMHGLGHHIGLDVHDVMPKAPSNKGNAFVPHTTEAFTLRAGHIVTIEPGIYFNDFFLKTYYDGEHGHLFDQERIATYMSVGGVRIEDCLLITEHGSENLTRLVKQIDEVESLVQGSSLQA